jgi:fumarate reductase flavoprotein subunit
MGMWIGAAIDDAPHGVMYFDKTGPDAPIDPPSSAAEAAARPARGGGFVMIARQPWLNVNINGERFMNEDLPWAYESNQIIIQPKSSGWKIWDRKFDQKYGATFVLLSSGCPYFSSCNWGCAGSANS